MNLKQFSKNDTQLAVIEAICEKSLYEFVKYAWDKIDSTAYIDDWYIEVICQYLEDLFFGKIKRLIINMPPRCGKSLICSVFFPVWCWIKDPSLDLFTGSYASALAIRDCVKSRYLIESPWFNEIWQGKICFSKDQNQKTYYTNLDRGKRQVFSIGGMVTGEGADIILLDDPINAMDAESEIVRNSTNQFLSESLSTRLNNPATGRILVNMQRLHVNDPSGFLLESGDWEHLCLPMRYEKDQGRPYDIRTEEGEILSSRFTPEALKSIEDSLSLFGGLNAVIAQMQQRPLLREGGYIKHQWLKYYGVLPKVKMFSWSFDTAIKKGQKNSYSAATLWAECEDGYYLVDMWREKLEYPELKRQVEILYNGHPSGEVLIEDKASGQQLLQDFKRIKNLPVIAMTPGKDMGLSKEERISFCSGHFEAGKVFFPRNKPWMKHVVSELTDFPQAPHDDILDTITQYLSKRLKNIQPRIYRV